MSKKRKASSSSTIGETAVLTTTTTTTAAKKASSSTSVFDAIQSLDSEDVQAERQLKKRTVTNGRRAQAVTSQSQLFGPIMECRILLQRLWNQQTTPMSDVSQINEQVKSTESSDTNTTTNWKLKLNVNTNEDEKDDYDMYQQLLAQLLHARRQLMNHTIIKDPSSDEMDGNDYAMMDKQTMQDVLQKEYEVCRDKQWKPILNRRHKDVRLHAGVTAKANAFLKVMDASFWQQVESTMEYEQLQQQQRQQQQQQQQHDQEQEQGQQSDASHCVHFDDSKVYQQLLKEFVTTSTKAAAAAAITTSTARFLQQSSANRSKSSSKKDVERRASKGRKLRYQEIPKLVHFTFPLSRPNHSSLDTNEWFHSLFGGVGTVKR